MTAAQSQCTHILESGQRCPNAAAAQRPMCEQHSNVAPDTAFQVASDHFRLDIQLFWTRSSFFMVAQAGLAAAAISQRSDEALLKLLSLVGVGLVFAWLVAGVGWLRWIHRWRTEIVRVDKSVNPFQ